MEQLDYKQILIDAGKHMLETNLTIQTWGNISLKDPINKRIYITPSGMDYSSITKEDICVLDLDGKIIEGNRKPSVEKMLHVNLYKQQPQTNAILHTHPMSSMVFAVLHKDIPIITDEMAQAIGNTVKCAKYALPGSIQLANNVCEAIQQNKACLLANHGAICTGKDIKECFKVATVLETSSQIYYQSLTISKPYIINQEDVAWMYDFAQNKYGQGDKK